MPENKIQSATIKGLSGGEVQLQRAQFGCNVLKLQSTSGFTHIIWNIVREPMFLLLVACLFFLLDQVGEGFMMLAAMLFVAAISVYQEFKSTKALQALQQLTDPKETVIHEGLKKQLAAEDLVPGDMLMLEEGMKVPADAEIIHKTT